ncbi:MAG: YbaB/EbfC family nucleoid-associated protein [Clostridiales bacterium]|jgi:DNA-binding YbaB/EbfC family protein|nr:YbaB/EbfC family nucleoid-associated protein [Clostridiales bacterium]
MARGGFGGMPPNMNQLMKQAQKMQKKMEDAQAQLEEQTLEVSAGGGVVKVVITGKKEIKELTIDPDAVDPEDVEMLQDLLISAINEALRQAEEMAQKEMGKFMPAGMGLPGGLF